MSSEHHFRAVPPPQVVVTASSKDTLDTVPLQKTAGIQQPVAFLG